MNKQKIMKWALPALLLSAMTFEIMPGSVSYYAKDMVAIPETAWNFFSPPAEGMTASCLILAGALTLLTAVLALVVTFLNKKELYKMTGLCSLGAAALASAPYVVHTENEILYPNVTIILILTVSWLLAMFLDKEKENKEEEKFTGRRL